MAVERIDSTETTDMRNIDQTTQTATDFRRAILTAEQDFPGTRYYPDWSKWFGYYKTVPELQAVINKKAVWTLGKGFEADDKTTKKIDRIRGCGIDTFNSIMHNNVIIYTACGDSFAEIVKSRVRKELVNLKPINPASMVIESNTKGIITGYRQIARYGDKPTTKSFKPEQIFHLAWNRLGDECHGRSTIEKLQWVIDAKNEAQVDMRIVFHRYVKPLILTKVDTDDPVEIAKLKTKLDNAVKNMENIIVPKDTVELERMSIPQYSTLDPLPWIQFLQQYFIMAEGVPEVILGFGRETTEASAKILYLAFQQNIEHNQRFLEEQIKAQLGLEVGFNFPADIAPEVAQDVDKRRAVNNMEMKQNVK